jgi:hypothetical protein
MICPTCRAQLGKLNAAGEPHIRMKGLVLKPSGPVALCPKCSGDVPVTPEVKRALQRPMVLIPVKPDALHR